MAFVTIERTESKVFETRAWSGLGPDQAPNLESRLPCLSLRRMLKSFDKSSASLDDLMGKDDWRGAIKFIHLVQWRSTKTRKMCRIWIKNDASDERFSLALRPSRSVVRSTSYSSLKTSPVKVFALRARLWMVSNTPWMQWYEIFRQQARRMPF